MKASVKSINLTKEDYKQRFKLIYDAINNNEYHCVVMCWRLANELLINLERDLKKRMIEKDGKTFLVCNLKKLKSYFKDNLVIGLSELIKSIKNHKPIALNEDTNGVTRCDCNVN